MSDAVQTVLLLILLSVLAIGGIFLAVDALELEITGSCRDCILLPIVNRGIE